MLQWVVGSVVSILSIITSILFFHSKRKNEKLESDFNDLWHHLEAVQQEEERIDKDVIALKKEVEMLERQIDQQFLALDRTQKELREFLFNQGEETKKLIRLLGDKVDKYLGDNNVLAIKLAEHIAKNGVKNG